jgi:hypothetical protein
MKAAIGKLLPIASGLVSGVVASLLVNASHRGSEPVTRPEQVVHVDHLAQHQEALKRHDAEARDARWSDATAGLLRNDLARLADAAGFTIGEVDCRTTSCEAHVAWSDYNASVNHYTDILHGSYAVPCRREMVLPAPENPSQLYETVVMFDCTRPDKVRAPVGQPGGPPVAARQ